MSHSYVLVIVDPYGMQDYKGLNVRESWDFIAKQFCEVITSDPHCSYEKLILNTIEFSAIGYMFYFALFSSVFKICGWALSMGEWKDNKWDNRGTKEEFGLINREVLITLKMIFKNLFNNRAILFWLYFRAVILNINSYRRGTCSYRRSNSNNSPHLIPRTFNTYT